LLITHLNYYYYILIMLKYFMNYYTPHQGLNIKNIVILRYFLKDNLVFEPLRKRVNIVINIVVLII